MKRLIGLEKSASRILVSFNLVIAKFKHSPNRPRRPKSISISAGLPTADLECVQAVSDGVDSTPFDQPGCMIRWKRSCDASKARTVERNECMAHAEAAKMAVEC